MRDAKRERVYGVFASSLGFESARRLANVLVGARSRASGGRPSVPARGRRSAERSPVGAEAEYELPTEVVEAGRLYPPSEPASERR